MSRSRSWILNSAMIWLFQAYLTLVGFCFMIGVPSIFNATTGLGGDHRSYWTEIRANQHAQTWFGDKLSPDFGPNHTYRFPTK